MDYRKVYMKIINNAIKENRKKLSRDVENYVYYEEHHILPKSLFPAWRKRKPNLVLLTAREHFFCYKLLTKIYPCNSTVAALWLMYNTKKHKDSSREYTRVKEEMVKYFNKNKKKNMNPFPGAAKAAIVNKELRSLPVYCPELDIRFSSQKEAAKYFKTSESRICAQIERSLNGKLYRGKYHICRVSKEG